MADNQAQPQTSQEEQIGFHKGALSTLAKERQELARLLGIVEQLMQMHVKGLKDLGIDLEKEAAAQQASGQATGPSQKPIEDMLK
jgi:hypothetical protein